MSGKYGMTVRQLRERLVNRRTLVGASALAGAALAIGSMARAAALAQDTAEPPAPDSYLGMLFVAPDPLVGDDPATGIFAQFSDFEAQSWVAGFDEPFYYTNIGDPTQERWFRTVYNIPFPELIPDPVYGGNQRRMLGFDIVQIDQALTIGKPGLQWILLRGHWDFGEMQGAWAVNGYTTIDRKGMTVWTIGDGNVRDDLEMGQFAGNRLNNITVMPDGLLVFAPELWMIDEAIDVWFGNHLSLADRLDVRSLVDSVTDWLTVAVLTGPDGIHGDSDSGDMPAAEMAIFTAGPGGPIPDEGTLADPATPLPFTVVEIGEAALAISVRYPTEDDAAQAAQVMMDRMATGTNPATGGPYRDSYKEWIAGTVPGQPIATLNLTVHRDRTFPKQLFDLLADGQFTVLAW